VAAAVADADAGRARHGSALAPGSRDPRAGAWLWVSALVTLGALALGVLLAPPASESPVRALTWLLFLGSSVHVAATGYLFTFSEVRTHAMEQRGRYLCLPTCCVAVAVVLAGVLTPAQLEWALLPYFCWQFFHFQKQNLGVVALSAGAFATKGPSTTERRALMLAGWAGILGLATRPSLLQLTIETPFGALHAVAIGLALAAVLGGLGSLLARPRDERPLGYCVVYLSSLTFFAPVFLFPSPYAAVAGMTIAHGFQYLVLVGLVARGEPRQSDRTFGIAAFLNIALLGGIALGGASHLHGGPTAGRLLFGVYLGLVMTHFLVDAGLWRLRDPFPRSFLSSRIPYLVAPTVARDPVDDRSGGDIR